MENIKIIFVVILMTFTMGSPARPVGSPLAPGSAAEGNECVGTPQIKQPCIAAAENGRIAAKSQTQTAGGRTEGTSDAKPDTREKDSQNSNEAESKPLKPFVPSEEIPADQAVDFPVDI